MDNSDNLCKRKSSYIFDDDIFGFESAKLIRKADKTDKINFLNNIQYPEIDQLLNCSSDEETCTSMKNKCEIPFPFKFDSEITQEASETKSSCDIFDKEMKELLPVSSLYANLNEMTCENIFETENVS